MKGCALQAQPYLKSEGLRLKSAALQVIFSAALLYFSTSVMRLLESLVVFVLLIITELRVTILLVEVENAFVWATHLVKRAGNYLI